MIITDKEGLARILKKRTSERLKEVFDELKKEKKIKDYVELKSVFSKRKWGVDFYVIYVDKNRYVFKRILIVEDFYQPIRNQKELVKICSLDSREKMKRKILCQIGKNKN